MLQTPVVESIQTWQATAVAAVLDGVGIDVLWWYRSPAVFAKPRGWFPCVAAGVWMLGCGLAPLAAWDSWYQHAMQSCVGWGAWLYGLLHILLSVVFWWIAQGMPAHPTRVAASFQLASLPSRCVGRGGETYMHEVLP
jgi:hypothetical protein